jgi:ABC-type transport system involved in multi-copper enzyme maturation permease subunit
MKLAKVTMQADSTGGPDLRLWHRQLVAIIGNEISKSLFSRSVMMAYALAIVPILLVILIAVADRLGEPITGNVDGARRIYGIIYSGFVLGGVVFVGSAAIFTTLFRGEILNRSMHYYLLCPVPRGLLVIGKFIAGLIMAMTVFGVATCASYLLMYIPFGTGQLTTDVVSGLIPQQMLAYLSITLLGCIGYGSIFLVTGLLFRNPLVPVVAVAGWELIHFLLPPALKLFGVVYYLKGLMPIPLDEGPLAVVVASPPAWISVVAMTMLALFCVAGASMILARLELNYTED